MKLNKMKLIYDVATILLCVVLLNSCELFWQDEGGYEYEGVIIDENEEHPLDGVLCQMFINEKIHEEFLTDSTGVFRLLWTGIINKNDAQVVFSKDKYKTIEMYSSMGDNEHFNDTIFMEKVDVE